MGLGRRWQAAGETLGAESGADSGRAPGMGGAQRDPDAQLGSRWLRRIIPSESAGCQSRGDSGGSQATYRSSTQVPSHGHAGVDLEGA